MKPIDRAAANRSIIGAIPVDWFVTSAEIVVSSGVRQSVVRRLLPDLVRAGRVETHGRGNGMRYRRPAEASEQPPPS